MKKAVILSLLTISMAYCSPTYEKKIIKDPKQISLYVDGMNGVENLVFDGKGNLFVTGLDGFAYRIKPTDDPYKGKIDLKKKLGFMCLGIEIADENHLYIAVKNIKKEYHLIICDKDFNNIKILTPNITGMNGIVKEDKYLYLASSNINPFWPTGTILRIDTTDPNSFKNPTNYVSNLGIVNGLKFSSDGNILYFSQLMGKIQKYNIKQKKLSLIYHSSGFFQLFDDILLDKNGNLLLCHNAKEGIVPFNNKNNPSKLFHLGNLKVPSAMKFGKGKGFLADHLYITEYGLKGVSLTMNGRGVWIANISIFNEKR